MTNLKDLLFASKNSKTLTDSRLDENVTLGIRYKRMSRSPEIGKNAVIRSNTVIYNDVEIGDNFKTGHGVWAYEKGTFLNYCPQCHSYGTLSYSKYCDGGQWTCSHCDCDYDMVLKTAFDIGRDNINNIMGTVPSRDIMINIKKAAMSVPGTFGIHNVRINYLGPYASVDLHVKRYGTRKKQ